MGRPERSTGLQGGGIPLYEVLEPSQWRELLKSLLSVTSKKNTIPKSKGIFTLAEWPVLSMEKILLFKLLPRSSCLRYGQLRAVACPSPLDPFLQLLVICFPPFYPPPSGVHNGHRRMNAASWLLPSAQRKWSLVHVDRAFAVCLGWGGGGWEWGHQ